MDGTNRMDRVTRPSVLMDVDATGLRKLIYETAFYAED